MKIVADKHIAYIEDYFGQYDLTLKPGRVITNADVKEADILIVRSVTKVDAALLQNSQVKFVGTVTAGCDHIDTEWLDQAGISYISAAGFNAPPVADYVLSVIASLQRKNLLTTEKPKAAVIGVGHVGRLVTNYLKTLNFEILQCDPIRGAAEADFISTPLAEISDCDLITLHVPLSVHGEFKTRHFIEHDFLRRQKPGCVLINASRGAVLASQDLKQYGRHLEWCLDVWEHEPVIDTTLMNACQIATPHIAGYSVQSKIRGIEMIYQELCARGFLSHSPREPISMPIQELFFAGLNHSWQEIILGIFNPRIITSMMVNLLSDTETVGTIFDQLRHQFTYRHELAFTKVVAEGLSTQTKEILSALQVKMV